MSAPTALRQPVEDTGFQPIQNFGKSFIFILNTARLFSFFLSSFFFLVLLSPLFILPFLVRRVR